MVVTEGVAADVGEGVGVGGGAVDDEHPTASAASRAIRTIPLNKTWSSLTDIGGGLELIIQPIANLHW